jgi:hypothetical protein
MPQKKPTKIYMNNSSANILAKNSIFHDRSKHIDTTFYYLREYSRKNYFKFSYLTEKYLNKIMGILL